MVYGIDPKVLGEMKHKDALIACKEGAVKRLARLTHKSCNQAKWCNKRRLVIAYIQKAIKY